MKANKTKTVKSKDEKNHSKASTASETAQPSSSDNYPARPSYSLYPSPPSDSDESNENDEDYNQPSFYGSGFNGNTDYYIDIGGEDENDDTEHGVDIKPSKEAISASDGNDLGTNLNLREQMNDNEKFNNNDIEAYKSSNDADDANDETNSGLEKSEEKKKKAINEARNENDDNPQKKCVSTPESTESTSYPTRPSYFLCPAPPSPSRSLTPDINTDNIEGFDRSSNDDNDKGDYWNGLPWAALVVFTGLGSALIAAIHIVEPTHLFVYAWIVVMLLTTIAIFFRSCIKCCKKPNATVENDDGGVATEWCTYLSDMIAFILLMSTWLVSFWAIEFVAIPLYWYTGFFYIGPSVALIMILCLLSTAKRYKSTDFWSGYWVSLSMLTSCFICGNGICASGVLAVLYSFPEAFPRFFETSETCSGTFKLLEFDCSPVSLIWFWIAYFVATFIAIVTYIVRNVKRRKRMINMRSSNTSSGSGIYCLDLYILLLGFPVTFLIIVAIPSFKLYISISIFVAATLLAATSWSIIHSCRRNNASIRNNDDNTESVDDADDKRDRKYPQDSYSFMALYGPMRNINLFSFGLMVFLFQSVLLIVMILSVTIPKLRTMGEVDNPDGKTDSWSFSGFFPANADPLVRAAQITSIMAYIIFQDASVSDFTMAIELFPRGPDSDGRARRLVLSCILRLIQGGLSMLAVFLLVMTSGQVVEIILNFTAVNFISMMDDIAFVVARSGKYGARIKEAAMRIEQEDLPECSISRSENDMRHAFGIECIFSLMAVAILLVVSWQEQSRFWVTQIVRVQFEESTAFASYSGCFEVDKSYRPDKRFNYKSFTENEGKAKLGYCKDKRRWLFFRGYEIDPCGAFGSEKEIARSPKTDSFDIEQMVEEDWLSPINNRLDMHFIVADDMAENCDIFLNDGKCDSAFNNFDYQYDGGDCCAATCIRPNICGKNALENGFGVEISGHGYSDCKAPGMVAITIRLDKISFDQYYQAGEITFNTKDYQIDKNGFNRKSGPIDKNVFKQKVSSTDGSTFDQTYSMQKAHKVQSITLKFDCNMPDESIYNVFTITINATKEMENRTEPAMVKDGSRCSLYTADLYRGVRDSFPTVHYSVFHGYGNEDIIGDDQFRVFEGQIRNDKKSHSFDVYGILSRDIITSNIGLLTNLTSIKLDQSGLSGTIPRAIGNLANLTSINLNSNQHTGGIPVDITKLKELKQLDLSNNDFEGNIPSEIGLLTDLTELNLGTNSLDGTFPIEIKSLTDLAILDLSQNNFDSGAIPSEIGLLTELTHLDLSENGLRGTLPSEVGRLDKLKLLDVSFNKFSRSTIPTEIGLLTGLVELDLSSRRGFLVITNFVGSVPSEIWSLTELQKLDMSSNDLFDIISSEIGLLTKLTELNLGQNLMATGSSIPSEIGLLTKLRKIDLIQTNSIGTIPTEIGMLTELTELNIGFNKLTGTLPTEMSLLTNLKQFSRAGNFRLRGTLSVDDVFDLVII